MPNRIIKESTFTSDRIAELSDFEFRLWVGLITQADDLGRGDARPAIIKGRVFALRERVTNKDIASALHALAAGGCITLYEVGGRPYYLFPSWAEHQRVRDVKPKYPGPEETEASGGPAALPQGAADRGGLRPESNTNPDTNTNTKTDPDPNPNPKAEVLCAGSPLDAAMDDYADARKAMKKPLTDKARDLTYRDLEKLAPHDEEKQIAILNQSVQRGWAGVYPLEEEKKKSSGNIFFDLLAEERGLI